MSQITMRRKTIGATPASPRNLAISALVAEKARWAAPTIVLLALFVGATSYAQESPLVEHIPEVAPARLTLGESAPALAFGKYLTSLQKRNSFTESGPVDMEIEASLPSLAKEGTMLAIRHTGASERSEYDVIRYDGDTTVKRQVIARYLDAERQAEALPYSSVAVTPANYKFRYLGSVENSSEENSSAANNGATVCIFQIVPKKKRAGLIRGQIWIDSGTGIAVHQAGRLVKRPSVFIRTVEVSRDTNLRDGLPYTRVTHVAIKTRLVGSAKLTITERPLQAAEPEPKLVTQRGVR
jgi:hypothetical protein